MVLNLEIDLRIGSINEAKERINKAEGYTWNVFEKEVPGTEKEDMYNVLNCCVKAIRKALEKQEVPNEGND